MLSASQEATLHPSVTGIIAPVCPELEPETQLAIERDLGKKCLLLGLQFPDQLWSLPVDQITPVPPAPHAPELGTVVEFLERSLRTHGAHKLFYASFGSHFTPVRRPELTTYLLDSLREARMPFIFANASPNSKLSQEYIDEVNAEGVGLITGMAPQMLILGHKATGFFIVRFLIKGGRAVLMQAESLWLEQLGRGHPQRDAHGLLPFRGGPRRVRLSV